MRPCCHCKKGLIPGNRPSDLWATCPACNGLGWGNNIFRILESKCRNGKWAFEEIVCYPGRFHASSIEEAKEYAENLFLCAFVEKVEEFY